MSELFKFVITKYNKVILVNFFFIYRNPDEYTPTVLLPCFYKTHEEGKTRRCPLSLSLRKRSKHVFKLCTWRCYINFSALFSLDNVDSAATEVMRVQGKSK